MTKMQEMWHGVYCLGRVTTWFFVVCKDLSIHRITGIGITKTMAHAMHKFGPIGFWSEKKKECIAFAKKFKS